MSDYKEIVRRLRGQAKQDGHTEYEAADAIEKLSAEVERWRESDLSDAVQRLDETKDAEIERLKQERDEALAARETYAMTARQDIIEKAKALDELEVWLRDGARSVEIGHLRSRGLHVVISRNPTTAPTLAAAIRAALEKASGQSGE